MTYGLRSATVGAKRVPQARSSSLCYGRPKTEILRISWALCARTALVPEEIEGTYFLYQIIKKRTILTNDSLFY